MKLEIERNIASPQEEPEEEFEPVMNGMAMDSVGFENIEIEERRPVSDPRCDEENLGDLEGKSCLYDHVYFGDNFDIVTSLSPKFFFFRFLRSFTKDSKLVSKFKSHHLNSHSLKIISETGACCVKGEYKEHNEVWELNQRGLKTICGCENGSVLCEEPEQDSMVEKRSRCSLRSNWYVKKIQKMAMNRDPNTDGNVIIKSLVGVEGFKIKNNEIFR